MELGSFVTEFLMHTRFDRSARVVMGALAIAFALACSDSSGPGGPKHPIVGVYDITTSVQTYEYPASTTAPYTFNIVAAGPARLSGTLTINDSAVVKPGAVELPWYKASMQETPCATTNPPCTSAGTARSADYSTTYVPLRVSGDSMGVTGALGSSYETLVLTTGTFVRDSIVGTLEWVARLGAAHEIYRGTYVARRHR